METTHLVPDTNVQLPGVAGGPLDGLSFMAKDLFDVSGYVTGAGNPDWARCQSPAQSHAWVVNTLLQAGANLTGKTITDELSLGFFGENAFYGTPLNPRAPDRIPGGSSSGSASAVAQGLCDVALGTDTGGSVRVPSSFCGLYGLRPTHGRVPVQGLVPQAPSSDTAGWFSRDAATMARVSEVMFGDALPDELPTKLVIATDLFDLCDADVRDALQPGVEKVTALISQVQQEPLAPDGIANWANAQRIMQMAEAWESFRDWVDTENPRMAFQVSRALHYGASVQESDLASARLVRGDARTRLATLLPAGTLLCAPTMPFVAPLKRSPVATLQINRDRVNTMCCFGGLAGHPQLSLPLGEVNGLPVGLSLIGARGSDMTLVAVAKTLEEMT
jgi:amidase